MMDFENETRVSAKLVPVAQSRSEMRRGKLLWRKLKFLDMSQEKGSCMKFLICYLFQ